MKNYQKFVAFKEDLEKNQSQLIAKLADAQKLVNTFELEMGSAQAMADASDQKLATIAEKLKENPTDNMLKAQHNVWLIHKSDNHARAESLADALEEAKKEYAQLVKENAALDVAPYADDATVEMKDLIGKQYKIACDDINAALEARVVYIEALHKVNQSLSKGKNLVEAGKKCASYAKKNNLGQLPLFETAPKPFLVTETDISRA
jgi:hypothetical protein